jgi:hypothetical protein
MIKADNLNRGSRNWLPNIRHWPSSEKERYKQLLIALVTNNAATTSEGKLSRWHCFIIIIGLWNYFLRNMALLWKGRWRKARKTIQIWKRVAGHQFIQWKLGPSDEDPYDVDLLTSDVGCRFYTCGQWPMSWKPVPETINLYSTDRPNPIGALLVLRPMLMKPVVLPWQADGTSCWNTVVHQVNWHYTCGNRIPSLQIEVVLFWTPPFSAPWIRHKEFCAALEPNLQTSGNSGSIYTRPGLYANELWWRSL